MEPGKDRIEIASDVSSRDGIGVEIYRGSILAIEIFRDDTEKSRTISVFKGDEYIDVPLDLMEKAISAFKDKIYWEFIEYGESRENKK